MINKFDNQLGQYKTYRAIDVEEELLLKVMRAFKNKELTSVEGFYSFTFTYKGTQATIYYLSPFLFDQVQITV